VPVERYDGNEEVCRWCWWWRAYDSDRDAKCPELAACLRRSPTRNDGLLPGSPEWPITSQDDFCGDFRDYRWKRAPLKKRS
jgi:hypothetical protein